MIISKKIGQHLIVQVPPETSICVMGDVHEHVEQFDKLVELWQPSPNKWLVSLGDIYDKGFGKNFAELITEKLIELQNDGVLFATRGNHELKLINKSKKNLDKYLQWWKDQPLVITFEFPRGKRVMVLHAGVTPIMTEDDLNNDIEVVYVRDVDEIGMIPLVWKEVDGVKTLVKSRPGGKVWHELYDGRFGYIVSGHAAQKDGIAKFYNYSCNIDTGVYDTGKLTAQIFLPNGNLGSKLEITGTASKPKLNIGY